LKIMPYRQLLYLILKTVILSISITFLSTSHAGAQEVVDVSVEYVFGRQVEFTGRIRSDVPANKVLISIRTKNETDTILDQVDISSDGKFSYVYLIESRPLRAFTNLDYWFNITLVDGTEFSSPIYNFYYVDNRYEWQHLTDPPFDVYWYEGDISFAQGILDVAREGLIQAQGIMPLQILPNISIFVYGNSDQIPKTPGNDWIAGHAYPDLGLIVVSIPDGPDKRLEMERQVPHELMHVLLYQTTRLGYKNLPNWLNEGLATMAQLYPTPEYQVLLENAIKEDSLIPISSLCQGFPSHASGAYLAYAEATYFTRYIYSQYGSSGLERLVSQYANGLDCERGVEVALGVTLSHLEEQWLRDSLGVSIIPLFDKTDQLLPWFFLLVVVLAIPLLTVAAGLIINQRKQAQV
jgi:hypothetical protein